MYTVDTTCRVCDWKSHEEGVSDSMLANMSKDYKCPECGSQSLVISYKESRSLVTSSEGCSVMDELLQMQKQLMDKVPHGVSALTARRMVAGLGIIEETLEYLNSTGHKPWRPKPLSEDDQLEEITDIFFFYLEEVILSGFSWEQVAAKYKEKHAINLERYRKALEGDTSWDKRGEKKEL
jgi:hypothetical protein